MSAKVAARRYQRAAAAERVNFRLTCAVSASVCRALTLMHQIYARIDVCG